jgi:hypothetical protein
MMPILASSGANIVTEARPVIPGGPVSLDEFPRYPLLFGPSPIHPLERLSAHLGGADIWAKREDCRDLRDDDINVRPGGAGDHAYSGLFR